jgi:tRNA1(Val) A37 N6-methylase TrmN6
MRRRRVSGQHATRRDVADLAASLCIRSPRERVLDPSCGEGVFLERAARRLRALGARTPRLAGIEIDGGVANEASRRVAGVDVVQGDFLALAAGARDGLRIGPLRRPFDVVIGNPPYIRQELIGSARKREVAALAEACGGPPLNGRCDAHAWFWAPALSCLRRGGRLGWVVSATWMDSAYGEALRAWLLGRAAVRLVIESQVEAWFDAARVRTAIVVVDAGGPTREPVRFVSLCRRLDDLVPWDLPETTRHDRFEDLARAIDSETMEGEGWHACAIAPDDLAARRWGASLVRAGTCGELIGRAGDRLVPLEQVATVRWGIKTGDDTIFFPRAAEAPPMEPGLLIPAVFSLMELDRLEVTRAQLRRRLLLIDRRRADHRSSLQRPESLVHAWLDRAARERRTDARPTCAARESRGARRSAGADEPARRWFELRPGPPGAILWSVMHQYRHLAPLNPGRFPANDNLLLIDPLPGVPPRLLAALLNSHVQALLAQAAGRRRNEGMLKTQAGDTRRMLVPDPRGLTRRQAAAILRAFAAFARRRIETVTRESARPDRLALDRAVLRALGLPGAEAAAMASRIGESLRSLHARERAREKDAMRLRRRGGVRWADVPG